MEKVLNIDTYANGQYTASADGYYVFKNRSTLEMKFTILNQRNNIKANVKKITNKELNLEYKDNDDTFLLKLYAN